ncbi:MAG: TIGR02556 family CRISPR-associated protein [Methanosarcinales archaeon]|uniref:TIGR02556 family CRISPR-associated protein n=1 Tax=Candidatus Ethanoperedens thermophilum TaxID=2766897 RepID=A0A848D8V9_9EURY|nr:TIGR02556 family CRISPR-associated protein [Candidatus Ethanoperedens thermophilum]
MIEAIRKIGEYAIESGGKSIADPINILVDSPANRTTKNVLFIVLERDGDGFSYRNVDIEEYSPKELQKYLYKKGSPNGTDVTPTSMITTLESTFTKTKIVPWFKQYNTLGLDEDHNFLVNIGNCIRSNTKQILEDLKEHQSKENNIISLKIDNKYLYDFKIFQDILVDKAKENYYSKYGKKSKSENQICSVCNKKTEVYGFVDTYKFYTVDKPGFVSGGFQQKNAWKNYPVCLNCALTLDGGKKYLQNNLKFNFYGFNYLLIPKFLNNVDKSLEKEIFKMMKDQTDPKFREREINKLTSDENEILESMSKQKNYLNLNFMFYDAPKGDNGSVFNILLYIEDVLPSRLKTLFNAKVGCVEENIIGVDQIRTFKECMVPTFENNKKTGEKPLEFNFGILRTFFPKISNNRTYNKYFLDVTNRIFTNKKIDYDFLMNFIMQKIRDEFVNGYLTKISTLKGFMLFNYLNKLKLVNFYEGIKMDENNLEVFKIGTSRETNDLNQRIDSFFSEFVDFFKSDLKKAIFLEGVLTQFLLNIQYQERNATPFRVKLKGLKLDENQIKKLLPEIQNKLEEYGKNYYRTLESIISKYLVSAGTEWNMSTDEISYYFVLGMNLSYLFKKEKQDDNKGEMNE